MALVYNTDQLSGEGDLQPWLALQLYNGLDCCVTHEAYAQISTQLSPQARRIYSFERAMQAPAMEMMLRGVLVDQQQRTGLLLDLQERHSRIKRNLLRLTSEVLGLSNFNYNSPAQLKDLFFRQMGLPEQWKFDKGTRKLTVNRAALEKLCAYFYAAPFAQHIMALRDLDGLIEVYTICLSGDGRIRTGYNPAGTETGRWSSNTNAFGEGSNMQNITDEARRPMIPDPGQVFIYMDLEQAESRVVAYSSNDENYIAACSSGDPHTEVAKLIWPAQVRDRKSADAKYYRHWSYRDMAKRGGHATNYFGQPPTIAVHLKIPVDVAKDFQNGYFRAFPGIRHWHTSTIGKLQTQGHLATALGRKRHFLGRREAAETWREAIAFEPQSIVGDLLNRGLHRLWTLQKALSFQILLQVHDAVLVQTPEANAPKIIPLLLQQLEIPVLFPSGKTMRIPAEALVGWNFQKHSNSNLNGLKKWNPSERRAKVF